MAEIIRNRTIRPSTRLEKSKSYKIDTKAVSRGDILIVNIDHETKPFRRTFNFNGADVEHKDSISFRVNDYGTSIEITWSGAKPIGVSASKSKAVLPKSKAVLPKSILSNDDTKKPKSKYDFASSKTSFDPISNSDTTTLILGTMPGDKSLKMNEYYGHSGNKFWGIISRITSNSLPGTYSEKKELLLKTHIGIWDVAHKVVRRGSLDSAIEDEEPNDLDDFVARHKRLRIIAFNGTKSEDLFDKYFARRPNIEYVSLPSTSPANTGTDFDTICAIWKQRLIKK